MRNTIKTLAAFLIVLSAAKSYAHTDSTSVGIFCKVVAQEKGDSFKLIYQGNKKANVSIKWIDNNSHVLYSENVKSSDSFVKQYDLTTLPKGEYTVKVVADDYEFTKEVITGAAVEMKMAIRNLGDKKVLLTGYPVKSTDLFIVVLNDKSERIFEQSISDATTIQKKFVFDQIDTDNVTFMIYSNDNVVAIETVEL
jgi:hypothetical protein